MTAGPPDPPSAITPHTEIALSPPADRMDRSSTPRLDTARLVLDYLRVLAWPVFAAALLLTYQPPLGRMLASLARKLDAAEKVSLGSLSLEVAARAREVGSPALADSIGELSGKAVEELMRVPRRGAMILVSTVPGRLPLEYGFPDSATLDALDELTDKGFINFREPLPKYLRYIRSVAEPADDHLLGSERRWYVLRDAAKADTARILQQGYELTESGLRAVEAITRAVASQLARNQ